ncbi:hypothetical protein CYMTET_20238 [Cymbomonas tetramitiformis]|uniref:Pectate lyase C n=1 Tax=Cymbomonas tetramitiformis TaxID=36881 RepID=A0AAE0G4X0_9CHLO|nr:hypothetical protein CYMTET_20238 [Cymbomonas tetramitiformis]
MSFVKFWLAACAFPWHQCSVASRSDGRLEPFPLFSEFDTNADGFISPLEYDVWSEASGQSPFLSFETAGSDEHTAQVVLGETEGLVSRSSPFPHANMSPQDIRSRITRGRALASDETDADNSNEVETCSPSHRPCYPGCTDLADGSIADLWVDSAAETCEDYFVYQYCNATGSGAYGTGWKGGTFEDYAVNGVSAREACCACGGGTYAPPAAPYPPPPSPYQRVAGVAVYVNASVAVIDDVTYASPQFDWAVQNPDVTSIHLRVHVALSAPLQELRNRSLSVYGECMDDAGGASRCLISGEETYSIFAAGEGSALYLEALELRDGYTLTFGAALRLSLANATLADCVLAANKAVGTEIKGGGVWAENSHLLCTSCRFEGNEAYLGAAIFATWSSTVVLDNTVLEGNAAGHSGGAIVIENGTSLTIGGASRVIGNTAKSYGGGLCVMENSRFELDGTSEISDNEATSGGGCTADSGSNITLRGLVSRNYAKDTGGALYTRFIGPNICLLDGCRIVNNTAKQLGGGIMLNAVESLVFFGNGSAITGNAALLNGGALYSRSTNIVLAENMTVSGNTAQESGGAFYLEKDTILRLVGSLVSNNRALDGGAIWTQGIWNATNGVRVVGNLADRDGGAVYGAPSAVLTVSASLVQANAASVGGGLYVEFASKMTLTDGSVLEHNTATHKGGGMFCGESSIVMVDGCSVSHNLVWLNDVGAGGGIYLEVGANASVAHCLLSNNSVSSVHTSEGGTTGGAVFMAESSTLTLDSTDLEMNSATEGGGVYASSNTTLGMRGSKAAMNMASYGGGISAQLDARVVLSDGSILVSNIAEHTGGGVMVQHLSVYDSQILNNSANTEGGGVYAQSFIEMVNATVSGNSASTAGGISFVSAWHAETEQSLQLTGCLVYGNRGLNGGGLHAEGQRNAVLMLRLDEGTIFSSNIAEETGGGLMMHKYTSLTMDNASLSNNTAVFGGGLYDISTNTTLITNKSVVQLNFAANSGGGVYMASLAVLVVSEGSCIQDNSVGMVGGGVYGASASQILIARQVRVQQNRAAREGGGIFLQSGLSMDSLTWLRVEDATVADNRATYYSGGGISSDTYCAVELVRMNLTGNQAGYTGGGYIAINSAVHVLDHTIIAWNTANHGGGIAMTASLSEEERAWADAAVLRITHTVFLENEGTTTAGALLVLGVAQVFLGVAAAAGGNASSPKPSNLLAPPAWSCRHSVCLERNFKGVMVFEGSTGNVLHDVLLTYNHDGHTGGGIEDGATVDVEGLSQVAIAMVHISLGSQVELRGCSFDGNVGSAVSVTDKSSTNLTHVAVENHTAMVGAGLTVDPDSSATVENSSFVKCRVLHGGAIYASGSLFVSGSLFKDNTALDGGALHLNLAHYGTQSVHHCKFIGNAAFGNGGVMMLEAHTDGEVNNISLQALQFSGNSARLGGAVGFWQPQDLSADPFPPPCDDCEPQNGTNMAAYGSPEGWATSALHLLVDAVQAQESSLQLVQHAITVRIADAFNATVTVDNTSVVELNLDTPACGLEGKNRVTVVAGIATFLGEATGIAFKGSPGISCQVFFTSDFTGINATEVTSNPTLVPLRYCTAGEQLLRSSAWTYCSACPEGSISLGNESQCTECAKYLDCELEEGECPITCPGGAAFVVCQGGYVAPEAQYCADDNECLLDRASTCPKEQACTTSEDAETCSRDDKNNAGRIGQGAATVGSLELCDRVAYAGPGSVMCGGKLPVSCSEVWRPAPLALWRCVHTSQGGDVEVVSSSVFLSLDRLL